MFQDKVVWITGASSGIGEAVAYEMARAGAKLVLSARREDELLRVAKNIDSKDVLILPFDVTAEDSLPIVVKQVMDYYGRIDLLLNNAGVGQRSYCVDTEMSTYRKLFEVDVFGQIALTKQVLPIMIDQKSGHIAVTASVAGKIGVAFRTGYCAVKHAMMGFFDALRTEVRPHNIKVTCITPGFIKTAISENALSGDGSRHNIMEEYIKTGMDVTKAAKIMVRGLAKGKKEIVVSKLEERMGLWIKRICPNLIFWIVAKKAEKEEL